MGFASPADDYLEGRLSLDALLIQSKDSTFFVRAKGEVVSYGSLGCGIKIGNVLNAMLFIKHYMDLQQLLYLLGPIFLFLC